MLRVVKVTCSQCPPEKAGYYTLNDPQRTPYDASIFTCEKCGHHVIPRWDIELDYQEQYVLTEKKHRLAITELIDS